MGSTVSATYTLRDTYDQSNFFSSFNFFTAGDPTHGDVQYVSQPVSESAGYIGTSNGAVYMGVDYKTLNPPNGRQSVRVSSNKAYNKGLFIADIAHMPDSTCGSWPAYWMFGPNWPNGGEIDIIEGVNNQNTNSITLHTAAGCTINNSNSLAGTVTLGNGDCNAGNANTGCSVSTANTNGYGTGFNQVGGGVYAMQWESSGIYVWFFQRGYIPSDILNGAPTLASWGTPTATFTGGGCNYDASFSNQNIIFDTTFCGDWAGAVWGSGSCASLAPTCKQYVDGNPGAFSNSYW